jgi:hypothetical protein
MYLKESMTREDAPQVVRESCQIAIDIWEVGMFCYSRTVAVIINLDSRDSTRIQMSSDIRMD